MTRIARYILMAAWWPLSPGAALSAEPTSMTPGFDRSEAAQMLELSAELNEFGVAGAAKPDTGQWQVEAEGLDLENTKGNLGFGPFNNRWKLWRHGDSHDYAIVVRGTIYDKDSIEEDLMANTLRAEHIVVPAGFGKTISYALASRAYRHGADESLPGEPVAEVHAGFAYGLTAMMFDRQHGLLKALLSLPPGSRLYITGHSQGAAIATLLHAFLHYACADRQAADVRADRPEGCPGMGLESKEFSLKGYVFAQPKPGNWRFAMDFAQSIGNRGLFYAIDNYDDPVVQAPLAFQMLSDSFTRQEIEAIPTKHAFAQGVLSAAAWFYRRASWGIDKQELEKHFLVGNPPYADQLDPDFINSKKKLPAQAMEAGTSLNYVPVGNIIAVRPRKADNVDEQAGKRDSDLLWEHHLWRYKQLSKYWP